MTQFPKGTLPTHHREPSVVLGEAHLLPVRCVPSWLWGARSADAGALELTHTQAQPSHEKALVGIRGPSKQNTFSFNLRVFLYAYEVARTYVLKVLEPDYLINRTGGFPFELGAP